jgi:hypothetical protein
VRSTVESNFPNSPKIKNVTSGVPMNFRVLLLLADGFMKSFSVRAPLSAERNYFCPNMSKLKLIKAVGSSKQYTLNCYGS